MNSVDGSLLQYDTVCNTFLEVKGEGQEPITVTRKMKMYTVFET